jgi:hypothetical protein
MYVQLRLQAYAAVVCVAARKQAVIFRVLLKLKHLLSLYQSRLTLMLSHGRMQNYSCYCCCLLSSLLLAIVGAL